VVASNVVKYRYVSIPFPAKWTGPVDLVLQPGALGTIEYCFSGFTGSCPI
jgi:hypothetical protein